MTRPRLLLVPEFTELAWGSIQSTLSEWADVATYDPPGVGAEPLAEEDIEAVRSGDRSIHDVFAARGLLEVERQGWDRFFIAADGWGNATAARIALERPAAVQGMALGHASLSFDMEGERPAVSREIWAAMGQLLKQDQPQFIRHGIVQMTRGAVTDDVAAEMLDRFPDSGFIEVMWDALGREPQPIGEMLKEYGGPLLLAQHVGCLSFTEEGFRDAVAAFAGARVLRVPQAPSVTREFADALRQFCESVVSAEAGTRS
jgi:pimeloyl-ACP methyl ester carboxylesterase